MPPTLSTVGIGRSVHDAPSSQIRVELLVYASDVLTPQLDDPLKPRCCLQCLSHFIATLNKPGCSDLLSYLLVENHGLFTACLAVLSAPRSDADIAPLRAQLKDNRLRCSNTDWHRFVQPHSVDDPLALFITTLVVCVSSGIHVIKSKGWFKAKARKGAWPMAPEQLLPYGAQQSVASYVFWSHTMLSSAVVPLLSVLLEIARSHVLPHLLAPPQKDLLIVALIAMLSGQDMPMLISATTGTPTLALPPQCAAELMYVVMSGRGAMIADLAALYAGHEHALYPALIATLDSGLIHDKLPLLTVCCTAAHIHERLSLSPSAPLHPLVLWYKSRSNLPEGANLIVQMVFIILCHLSRSKMCTAAGCSALGKQTCARCKIVRYCGRACQQSDWTVPRRKVLGACAAHKAVCRVLCRLRDAGVTACVEGKTQLDAQFVDTYRRANIDTASPDCQNLVSWGIAAGFVPSTVLDHIGSFFSTSRST